MAESGGDRWGEFTLTHWMGNWAQVSCDQPPVDLGVKIESVDGAPQVVGLYIGHLGSQPVEGVPSEVRELFAMLSKVDMDTGQPWPQVVLTANLLRSLPIGAIKRAALAHRRRGFGLAPVGSPGKGPAPLPDARFQEAADIYRAAVKVGESPILAVQTAYGLKRAGARRYIRIARDRGFLGWHSKSGVAGFEAESAPYRRKPAW
ncbi:MAG: DUF6214 family protein [Candidatus Dormiibacterota bacterium]